MRHGYEWWEAYDKWLLKEAVIAENRSELATEQMPSWLKRKKKEFEKLWNETPRPWKNVLVPPKNSQKEIEE